MTEEELSPERRVAMREQALKDMASAMGAYYHELRAARVPRELAFELSLAFQHHWFDQEMRNP